MEVSNIRSRLRSSIPQEVREAEKLKKRKEYEESLNRPQIDYNGKIHYYTALIDCACVCDNLLDKANNAEDIFILGFDMEWYFSFQTGPGKTAVIQISSEMDTCHILHIYNLGKLPKALSELLTHPKVRLTGVNIKNDIRKLARDFPGVDADKIIENCIDLGVFANSVLPFQQRWSLEKLVNYCLKLEVDKSKKVRMSKWHVVPLTDIQKRYAAIDVYASLKLYFHLKELEEKNRLEDTAFQ